MDAIETLKYQSDTSLFLAIEAQRRGHELHYYQPNTLSLVDGKLAARTYLLQIKNYENFSYKLDLEIQTFLEDFDVILVRQDPPFDMRYITSTYFLEHVPSKTLILNNPTALRNCPEKLLITHFPELCPPTLITEDIKSIVDFQKQIGAVVLKPLYRHGGQNVVYIDESGLNCVPVAQSLLELLKAPLIVQKFLPGIYQGDKRVFMLNGKAMGCFRRVPAAGDIRSNLVAGGRAVPDILNEKDLEICQKIGPVLKKQGILLAGIDIIGNYVTEINITSPTGLVMFEKLTGINLAEDFWDHVEAASQDQN